MATINELRDSAYKHAKDKGFYESYNELCQLVIDNTKNQDKEQNDFIATLTNLLVTQKLALIGSEINEALEAWRSNKFTALIDDELELLDLLRDKDVEMFTKMFKDKVKDTFEDELADSVIRMLELCGFLCIDIESHIKYKMEYNKTRGYKHGKEF